MPRASAPSLPRQSVIQSPQGMTLLSFYTGAPSVCYGSQGLLRRTPLGTSQITEEGAGVRKRERESQIVKGQLGSFATSRRNWEGKGSQKHPASKPKPGLTLLSFRADRPSGCYGTRGCQDKLLQRGPGLCGRLWAGARCSPGWGLAGS